VAITYVDSPDRVRAALSPVRRDLLKRLRVPSSASRLRPPSWSCPGSG